MSDYNPLPDQKPTTEPLRPTYRLPSKGDAEWSCRACDAIWMGHASAHGCELNSKNPRFTESRSTPRGTKDQLKELALRFACKELIDALPKCDACVLPATHALKRGEGRWCQTHAPQGCPPYPRAEPLEKLRALLAEPMDEKVLTNVLMDVITQQVAERLTQKQISALEERYPMNNDSEPKVGPLRFTHGDVVGDVKEGVITLTCGTCGAKTETACLSIKQASVAFSRWEDNHDHGYK